jgi:membrane protein implicated in regulation of membrane protease activity
MIWQEWWLWMAAALVLAGLELLAPAFVLLGFAIGAGLVGLGLLVGFLGPLTAMAGDQQFALMLVIFAVLSLVSWIVLRRVFHHPSQTAKTFDYDIND